MKCASKEQELELKLRGIEEEWSEQLLHFSPFKNRGIHTLHTVYIVYTVHSTYAVQHSVYCVLCSLL